MPISIVYDRDPAFTSAFWKECFKFNGTKFSFSSSYHPQMDGQTMVVNCTPEMYLWCFTSDNLKYWVKWLRWFKFYYNTSFHSATKMTPFEVVYGCVTPSLLSYVLGTTRVAVIDKVLQDKMQYYKWCVLTCPKLKIVWSKSMTRAMRRNIFN